MQKKKLVSIRVYSWLRIVFIFLIFTAIAFSQPKEDTIKQDNPKLKYYSKSPGLAMLLSATLPGGGQFYTANYFKGILFVGAEATLGYYAYKNHQDYQATNNLNSRNKRNNFLWWIASVKLLSIADAYVSANMYKFKDMMRLSYNWENNQLTFGLQTKL